MVTENNQPEWVAEILKMVARVQKDTELSVEAFNATAAKSGMLYAIEWRSADAAATHALSDEVEWLGYVLTNERHEPEAAAGLVVKEIESRKGQLLGCFRVAASTSAFANAIENAKLEARVRAFDSFGGFYTQVCHIIANRNK